MFAWQPVLFCCHNNNHPQSSKQSAIEEFEDVLEARQREKAEFQPGPRATPADLSNDMRTMGRQLDKMLYLLVRKDRTSHCWQMPQGALEEGESLLQVTCVLGKETISFEYLL